MNNNNNILSELKTISPAVANIENKNVYSVPSYYFANLSEEIVRKVKANELLQQPISASYTVPENYFEQLPSAIMGKIEEDSEINFSKNNPYSVPTNYFNTNSNSILEIITNENLSVTHELQEIAPILNNISKNNVYTVPENYFEMNQPFNVRKPAKVIQFTSIVRYAVAAAIIGFISLSTFQFLNSGSKNSTIKQTAKLNVEKEVLKFSDEDIIKFLEDHANGTDAIAQINTPQEDYKSIDVLNNLTEDDIEKYLKETNL